MATSDLVQKRLSTLPPYSDLRMFVQHKIKNHKEDFPHHQELMAHLSDLGISDIGMARLADYIVWIPQHRFACIEKINRGGFGTVYKGTVTALNDRGLYPPRLTIWGGTSRETAICFALKETDRWYLVSEVYIDCQISHQCSTINLKPFVTIANPLYICIQLITNIYLLHTEYPAVLPVVGLSQSKETGKYLLVFDYAELGSLEQNCIKELDNWVNIALVAQRLAASLSKLHYHNITHCDLHPGNVVFTSGRGLVMPWLIDVGLSRFIEWAQEEEGVYGCMLYMPPEIFQTNFEPYSKSSDIYCFGTLIWQMVTGAPPRLATAVKAIATRPDKLREDLIPGAPNEFNNIIRGCWNPDPRQRPSMENVMTQLWRLCDSLTGVGSDRERFEFAAEKHPFSAETRLFINKIRAAHELQQNGDKHCLPSISTSTASADTALPHRSQFYSRTTLREFSLRHSQGTSKAIQGV